MEKKLLNSPLQPNDGTDSEIAELLLNHTLRQFRRESILKEIDLTLQEGNKQLFFQLTEELKKIS